MSIFRKCHIKLFLIVQVGDPFRLWLHFYSVFEFPPKSVFHYFGLSWARLEKCIVQSAENFKEHRFHFFDILRILEPDFQNIHIPGPRKSVLGPGDVFGVSKNHRCIYNFEKFLWSWADPWYKLIVYMLSSIWHYYFFKNIYIKFEMIVKGVSGKSGFFWIELPIELPIGPCYSGVE